MPRQPRSSDQNAQLIQAALVLFGRLPTGLKIAVGLFLVAGAIGWFLWNRPGGAGPTSTGPAVSGTNADGSGRYLFCFWNVENMFDDHHDKRRSVDAEYDEAFAGDEHFRRLKYDHISSALVRMNGGKGPDVIACAELESPRAAELLKDALNDKLDAAKADPSLRYTHVAMKDLDAGRHIAPGVITRLGLGDRVALHGSRLRILETHIVVNGHDLYLMASHWTSQLRQRDGGSGEHGREKYAETIYGAYSDLVRANPRADFLLCGDFNDTPDSEPVVRELHATSDRSRVTPSAMPPALLDLMAGKSADRFGTLWYGGKPLIYDHICVSPGMLDSAGWACDPESIRTASDGLTRPGASRREPWRFGNPRPAVSDDQRGYADHFPVVVELTVAPPGGMAP
jgi:endonuclease/exonuclease/phosphatase family metal-dependent hydrolase